MKKEVAERQKMEEINQKKHKEAEEKSVAESFQKDDIARKAKAEAAAAANREKAKLAKEEAHKTTQRIKYEKEAASKNLETGYFQQKERKTKDHQAKEAEKEVQKKFVELASFKQSLELTNKEEKRAKEEQTKAAEDHAKAVAVASELNKKSAVIQNGYQVTKEASIKDEAKKSAKRLAAARETMRIKKIAMANTKCAGKCLKEGKKLEKGPQFTGCFKDKSSARALHVMKMSITKNSVDWCNSQCAENPQHTYFGVQERMCFCGKQQDNYKQYGAAAENQCILRCDGNHKQMCGGPEVNRMYKLATPEGKYDWSGYTTNTSRPSLLSNYNFAFDTCHCVGTIKPEGAP